ncbi:helix-turn-helix domain-containing protein [Clostridium perfringens]|uniref:helix-turn-helix domain-containing protein n=1 Tax=Clostridium perfringens TaxID=1502 RepID=UPI000D717800|nr:helix-turn-helix transcriptional regulator [Clostridium perfringens]MCC2764362.1 helix-turn-helix domain-containing protein [Clostridium perfringens]MCG4541013.1 helix-turn-helix domain-containing protein [Clostridium perfringens]MCG4544097.1 helix-turn-helix domain-containing protein [Clostridium perfringens]MCG4552666.1 helix-turn-helix domain-containing protein [Clostridium perfringens]MCG4555535.1 helix-turn-helix domain-containing protein [Clostridium perfringens]
MISKNITRIAKEKNITMYRIAKDSNLSMSYVWEICKGKRENPSIAVICKIAKVLGTTVEELISK